MFAQARIQDFLSARGLEKSWDETLEMARAQIIKKFLLLFSKRSACLNLLRRDGVAGFHQIDRAGKVDREQAGDAAFLHCHTI